MDKDLIKLFREAQATVEFHRKTDYHPFIPPKIKVWHKKEKKMFEVLSLDLYKKSVLIDMLHKKGSWKVPTLVSFEDIELVPESPLKLVNGENAFFGDFVRISEQTYRLFKAVGWEREENNPLLYLVMYRPDLAGWGKVDLWDIWYAGGNPYFAHASYLWLANHDKELKVVGNMFQNPELLDPETALNFMPAKD